MALEPGVYDNVPNEEYHSNEAISKTGLDLIRRSPAHYKAAREHRVETKAMADGTAVHCAVLEPDEYPKRYAVAPAGIDRRTKVGKEAWAAFQAETEGKIILSADDDALFAAMRDSVYAHPAARRLLESKDRLFEHTIIARDPEHGVLSQCRPDLWLRETAVMVDLKTTLDASPAGFAKSTAQYRYHVGAAFYPDVLSWATGEAIRTFVFIAVEKTPPHAVGVYHVTPSEIDTHEVLIQGWHEYREDLGIYADCLQHDLWPAYSNRIEPLQLPHWAKRKQVFEPRRR
jgi:exodeoxyribonuclease VIII